jgi:hypothetical protein
VFDFDAAVGFLVGSILFLSEATKSLGIYLFILGSVLFLLKPAIRLQREAQYAVDGDVETLARRAGWRAPANRSTENRLPMRLSAGSMIRETWAKCSSLTPAPSPA